MGKVKYHFSIFSFRKNIFSWIFFSIFFICPQSLLFSLLTCLLAHRLCTYMKMVLLLLFFRFHKQKYYVMIFIFSVWIFFFTHCSFILKHTYFDSNIIIIIHRIFANKMWSFFSFSYFFSVFSKRKNREIITKQYYYLSFMVWNLLVFKSFIITFYVNQYNVYYV